MTPPAQGIYRYWRDGVPQPIEEPWQILEERHGWVLRSTRNVEGCCVLAIEARYQERRCHSFRLDWMPEASGAQRSLHYRCEHGQLQWQEPERRQTGELPFPDDHRLFPLVRAASGPLLRDLSIAPATVVLPCLQPNADAEAFLRPMHSRRRAEFLDRDDESVDHLRYYGGEYGTTGSDYWVDANDWVQRYRWHAPDGCWEVRNETQARDADEPGNERSSPGVAV